MADAIGRAWTNFAYTGNPNTTPKINSFFANMKSYDDLTWPQWVTKDDNRMTLESPTDTIVSHWRQSYCDFWDQIGYFDVKK